MPNPTGALLPADEAFNHQVTDTFASVGTSDPSWTEKVCAMAMARDGSLQIGFGLGKYTNRNVMSELVRYHHGEWRGELHVDGERIADCTTPEQARRLHQIRDTPVRVTDPVGGGEGWGNCQPIAAGPCPELGLGNDSWM